MKRRVRLLLFSLVGLLLMLMSVPAFAAARAEVAFPAPEGYMILKCDFHMHTIFSDGAVLPQIRVREAWLDGLDAIAITDHVEHQNREGYVNKSNMNVSYELAKPEADKVQLILIRGAEITRELPHGHFNAVGITDANPLNDQDNAKAIQLANEQGGFVFWNHPPSTWSPVQDEYVSKGWMRGIEVFNGDTYYPHSHRWCIEKKLTILATSDEHGLIAQSHDAVEGKRRPMTLVFAKERTEEAILDALRGRRTVAFANGVLVGEAEWAKPLFEAAVEILNSSITLTKGGDAWVRIKNHCAASFVLEANGTVEGLSFPSELELPAGKTAVLRLRAPKDAIEAPAKAVALPYKVKSIWVAPEQGLEVAIELQVTIAP